MQKQNGNGRDGWSCVENIFCGFFCSNDCIALQICVGYKSWTKAKQKPFFLKSKIMPKEEEETPQICHLRKGWFGQPEFTSMEARTPVVRNVL
jgi:hypothetical protein